MRTLFRFLDEILILLPAHRLDAEGRRSPGVLLQITVTATAVVAMVPPLMPVTVTV
jgi:hypothetical protein